nr:unconventional myosin-IXAa-like [Oncorhynchus nerka]
MGYLQSSLINGHVRTQRGNSLELSEDAQIFSLLSAILYLGNILYKKKTYRDDSIDICNPDVLPTISELLQVKEEMLFEALTTRKTVTVGERLIVPYKLAEAGTVRDSMAKSLYSALFDWIVFRTNHALLNNKDLEHSAKILSIGVLDIFGFEDYENNSFEQFCINLANERLHHYFNQHLFKLEQEEYRAESISWHNIDYIDNTGCINLISKKPTALLHLLDEECNFPQASNQTLLDKFKRQHEGNSYIEFPAVMEPAFIICHYAGKVKYGIKDFREKNTDHMRPDIVALLKSSKNAFICGLMGIDPVATFRWAVLRTYFRAMVAFREAGKRHADKKTVNDAAVPCVVKSVDSFSFLHHPVHQRSLEILQRCKDEKYNITRKNPRTPLSDLQGSNTLMEKPTRDGYGVGCNGRRSRQGGLSSGAEFADGIFFNSTGSKLLERAQSILMRNKNYKSKPSLPKHLLDVKSLRYLSSVTLHDRITKSLLLLHKKKKTPSISAQFQASLNKLMETLGQSEPYFVKCVRSNAEKLPLRFNDALVLRQLRYTGMLETVRIRQSGYAIKYTFQDFVRHFRVLLPDITRPTKSGIREFFRQVHLAPAGYQVGNTMVFLRDAERQRLQALLHKEVLGRIVTLQRRFRARLERKHFINMRQAADVIQRPGVVQQRTQPSRRRLQRTSSPGGGCRGPRHSRGGCRGPSIQEEAAEDSRPGGGSQSTQANPGRRPADDQPSRRRAAEDPAIQEEAAEDPAVQEEAAEGPQRQAECSRGPSVPEEAAADPACPEEAAVDPSVGRGSSGTSRPGGGSSRPSHPGGGSRGPSCPGGGSSGPSRPGGGSRGPSRPGGGSSVPAGVVEGLQAVQAVPAVAGLCPDNTEVLEKLHPAQGSGGHYGADSLARLQRESPPPFTELKEQSQQEKQLLNGQSSPTTEEEKADRTMGLDTDISEDHVVEITHHHGIQDVSTVWPTEDSNESRWKCLLEEEEDRESERRPCIDESSRQSIEPSSHKTRAKRQNRRMRELEQTQFSLELLKVRTHRTGGTLPEEETHVPPCPDSISCPLDDHQHHRPSSPDSHGSTSIDVEVEAGSYPGYHVNQSAPLRTSSQEDSVRPGPPIHTPTESQSHEHPEVVKQNDLSPGTEELSPMLLPPIKEVVKQNDLSPRTEELLPPIKEVVKQNDLSPRTEELLPPIKEVVKQNDLSPRTEELLPPIKEVVTEATQSTVYIPPEDHSSEPKPKQQSPNKRVKERRESSSRGPVVVVISMQKETLLDEGELRAAKAQESALQMGVTPATFSPTPIAGLEVSEKAQPPRTVTKPPRDLAGVDMSSLVPSSNSSHGLCPSEVDIQISPAGEVPPSQQERKVGRPAQDNWVSTDRILESREAALASQKKTPTKTIIVNMTEKPPSNVTFSPRRKLPFSKSDKDLVNKEWSLASVSRATTGQTAREAAHKEVQKSIHKTMSSGDLGKVASLRKTSSQDGSRVRGKIRFWGKTKHAEKKLSRDKQQSTQRDGTDKIDGTTSPPHSPNLMGTRGRETKENKEPSPKVSGGRCGQEHTVVESPASGERRAAHPHQHPRLQEHERLPHEEDGSVSVVSSSAVCRYACHRKCCSRMTTKCSKKYDLELSSRQFGVEVSRLTSEERTVPLVVEKLINYIEMHGLYTEGIFRKSGSTNKIKELRQGLDTDVSSMNLDDYNIHVIAGVLKQWLRDLPNPLMTFELYEEFLRAMGQPDQKEVIRGVYSVIDLLSRTHLSTLERLIFHLVRIALQEDTNRMSANALAIVFAPCILRCPDTIDPLQSVQDIGKTTACVELIIGEQMNKYRARLKDINSLEFAENKAKSRLTHIRKSMKPVLIAVKFIGITRTTTPGKGRLRRGSSHHTPSPPLSPRVLPVVDGESAEEERAEPGLTEQQQATMQQEERVLTEQIEGLQREKEELTYEMLILEPRASDDETLESEASIGTADSSEKLNMDPEGAAFNPSGTYHSRKSEAKSRRCLRRQPDSVDSTSSSSSIIPQSPQLPLPLLLLRPPTLLLLLGPRSPLSGVRGGPEWHCGGEESPPAQVE